MKHDKDKDIEMVADETSRERASPKRLLSDNQAGSTGSFSAFSPRMICTPRFKAIMASVCVLFKQETLGDWVQKPSQLLCIMVLLNNQLIFAGMHVMAKRTLHYIPPMALAMMRVAIAVPFLFAAAWKEGSLDKLKLKDMWYLMVLGMVGVCIPQTLIFVGNVLCGPNIIAIMQPAAPVYAMLFASALKLEKLTVMKGLGAMMAVSGAIVVMRPDQMDFQNNVSIGVIIMIFQTMSYAAFLVLLKIKTRTHPYPFGIYAYASLFGLCFIILIGIPSKMALFDVRSVPSGCWVVLIYLGVVVSFFAHACQSWAVQHTDASLPALFACIAPFLVAFLSFLVLGDKLGSASDIIGLILNVVGLLLVVQSRRKEAEMAQREQARVLGRIKAAAKENLDTTGGVAVVTVEEGAGASGK